MSDAKIGSSLKLRCGTHASVSRIVLGLMVSAAPASAWAQQAQPQAASAQSAQSSGEIVVTAEKRSSTVQSVPISMTALSGGAMQAQGISSLQDVIRDVPGISMRTAGAGQTELEMRGLASSGGSSPTVGFYLDEVPLSPPAASLNGKVVIDPDLYDLNRMEVLRGPQGTLYGSGSMGGTVKMITNEPNLHAFAASFDATLAGTKGSGEASNGFDGMINIPLVKDRLALRIVGTEKYTSGWIDRVVGGADFPLANTPPTLPSGAVNPAAPAACQGTQFYGCIRGDVANASVSKIYKDVNASVLHSARAALLFQATDNLSFEATGMYQRTTANGYSEYDELVSGNGVTGVGAEAGRLAHYQPFDIAEPFSDTFKMGSGVIKYDAKAFQITSSTSYWSRSEYQSMDAAELMQVLNYVTTDYYIPISFSELDTSKQFSEELRAASKGNSPFQWVAGLFYSDLQSTWHDVNTAVGYAPLSTGGAAANPTGIYYASNNPYHMKQYAAFGEASYKVTDKLKATVGLRYYKFDTHVDEWQAGIGTATGNATPTTATVVTSASGLNPRFNLSYIPDRNLTMYATIAKGFRPGGVSLPAPPSCGAQPTTYGPDSVWSYEAGEKAKLFGGKLTVNGDIYMMNWTGVQQNIAPPCGYPYTANAGNARAWGPEVEITARLTDNLTANISGTATSAKLTSVNPNAVTPGAIGPQVGDPILNIPNHTVTGALTYKNKIMGDVDFTARLSDNYIGQQYDIAFTRQLLPAYNMADARFTFAKSGKSITIFATNLTNTRAELTVNNTAFAWLTPTLTRVSTNQPRTLGATVAAKF